MKASYTYVKREDVQACKELVRTMIKRDRAKGYLRESSDYAYHAARFFDCMDMDFRMDLYEWTEEEMLKGGTAR